MPLTFFFEALGGLGLFILGMRTMSEGLQKIAGERLRSFLEKITDNRLTAALLGSCLASLLQSSSAASILVVGFVNAGLLSLYQSLAVLLGTGIGTSLAIQLIAFKISFFSLPAIFSGVILKFFCTKRRWVNIGTLLLGTGLVFFGVQIMETGFSPLKQSSLFPWLHQHLLSWRLSAILAGAVLTFLIQSGSAAIAVIIALAGGGLLNFDYAVAMVIGEVIGSSFLTVLASLGGTATAKKTVIIYFLINMVAVSLVMIFFPFFREILQLLSTGQAEFTAGLISGGVFSTSVTADLRPYSARHLANAHTLFSFLSALLFLPLIGFLARSATFMLPARRGDTELRPQFIDHRVINTPTIAILQARNEVKRMADIACSMYSDVVAQLHNFNAKTALDIKGKEAVLDVLQRDISSFLITLSRQQLSAEYIVEIPTMLQLVNDLEHLGDQSEAIMEYLRHKKDEKLRFSTTAMTELKEYSTQVAELVGRARQSLDNQASADIAASGELLVAIMSMHETLHNNHITRLHNGKCSIVAGLLYGDMIAAFARIAQFSYAIIETERGLQDVTAQRGR
jgi:phosphate:Na+ symporter